MAIGKPVAFEASAEERETRGFISITMISSVSRLTANWMFEPPVSTPTARITAIAWSRSSWYWRSDSVCCGATVTESPVWTPIGSMFSIEQTITTLSLWSRITSSSNSPQPITDSSTSTWPIGLAARPSATIWWSSASLKAMPPPSPPIVKPGRMIAERPSQSSPEPAAGRPMSGSATSASLSDDTAAERAVRRPAAAIVSLNRSRSSARWIAS